MKTMNKKLVRKSYILNSAKISSRISVELIKCITLRSTQNLEWIGNTLKVKLQEKNKIQLWSQSVALHFLTFLHRTTSSTSVKG